ncbi:MAG: chloride channel protein [Nitrospirota bacterium]|nr:chloride channel protein [Nitrospirota bacterium]
MLTYLRILKEDRDILVSFMAILVGLCTGFAVVLFNRMIETVQVVLLGSGDPIVLAEGMQWWHVLLLPVAGGCLVALLFPFIPKSIRVYGVAEVIDTLHEQEKHPLNPRAAFFKLGASSITIGSGGALGKEGPSVEMGAVIGDWVASLFRIPAEMKDEVKVIMIGSGAAAAIAAVFNSPFGGVAFAMEVVLSQMHLRISSPIFLASATGAIVSTTFIGPEVIHVPDYHFVSLWEVGTYLGLALVVAAVGTLFTNTLQGTRRAFDRMPLPEWMQPIFGGAVVGGFLVFFPHVYGTGVEAIAHTLNEDFPWQILLVLVFVKLIVTAVTLGSRGFGGLFGPALFMGAVTGGAYGALVHKLLPTVTATSGAYAVVGMGAVLGTIAHAPITATIIIFDFTHDYRMILPVAVVTLISTFLSVKSKTRSIYRVTG